MPAKQAKGRKRQRQTVASGRKTPPSGPALSPVARKILARTRTPAFQRYLRDLLVELCRFDTTPNPEVQRMQAAEDGCFRVLERELRGLAFPGTRLERRPVNPAIQTHPHYSLLHFTKTSQRPQGLSPEETYAHRSNLVCFVPGAGGGADGQSVALNAHIDVVAPYFPPRVKGGTVFGRGACDDKGPVASVVAALKVLAEVMAEAGLKWNRNVLAMLVVEEETGGNGSLSLAMDRELRKLYDSIVVCECTGLKFYPANRGAVWYRTELNAPPGVSAFELFAFVNEEMEKEGAAIRAESRHPLFPQRPVQTCHGIIGPFGEHPSRICGEVSFAIRFGGPPGAQTELLVGDCLAAGLAGYVGLYGDKTKVTDPATGRPMVARHYDFRREGNAFMVKVHGATGHMGAIRERDGAITKLAHLVRGLVASKAKLEASAGSPVRFELARQPQDATLVLEGGQGFLPTHGIIEVMERLRRAAWRGAENCLRRLGRAERGEDVLTVTYEKLHNVAFDGDPDSPSVRNAVAAAKACGIWKDEPILGWTVSCDARLFATEYPEMQVLTFGPGQLAFAHSDQEQIALEELRAAVEFLALFLLRQTGTLA
ncbi:MAG TPA: M20/M25/M40 family metallo-hydrolase [Candidatus Paceibacterota bacterium]|nr:M20/M25/M40 family metallo-hydrolase [Verrucomicrobiota bacterium]HSA12336.1 M20/M25/M40 family metallo-hydrolase [Candidatus Paceibacterota bacterium]